MQMLTLTYTTGSLDYFMFLVLMALGVLALVTFITLQLWLQSPRRAEFNKAWFAQFEAHLRKVYGEGEVGWRVRDLCTHFDRSVIN
jgi:hypothetical protein